MQLTEKEQNSIILKGIKRQFREHIEDAVSEEAYKQIDVWVKNNRERIAIEIAEAMEKEVWPEIKKRIIAEYKKDGELVV